MPKGIFEYADGRRVRITTYEVRTIDRYGDAQDVEHYETKREALTQARELMRLAGAAQKAREAQGITWRIDDETVAVVVERHVSRSPAHLFDEPDSYKTLATFGDKEALEEGGWNRSGVWHEEDRATNGRQS